MIKKDYSPEPMNRVQAGDITCIQANLGVYLAEAPELKNKEAIGYKIGKNTDSEPSMSAPGCPNDDSCAERFFASLKKELIYRKKYATIEVRTDVFGYIELFCNRKRLYNSLGHISQVDYRPVAFGIDFGRSSPRAQKPCEEIAELRHWE